MDIEIGEPTLLTLMSGGCQWPQNPPGTSNEEGGGLEICKGHSPAINGPSGANNKHTTDTHSCSFQRVAEDDILPCSMNEHHPCLCKLSMEGHAGFQAKQTATILPCSHFHNI